MSDFTMYLWLLKEKIFDCILFLRYCVVMCGRNEHDKAVDKRCMWSECKEQRLCHQFTVPFMSAHAESHRLPFSTKLAASCIHPTKPQSQLASPELCFFAPYAPNMAPVSHDNSIPWVQSEESHFRPVWQHLGKWHLHLRTHWLWNGGSEAPADLRPPASQYLKKMFTSDLELAISFFSFC